jgi:hypothetical protein
MLAVIVGAFLGWAVLLAWVFWHDLLMRSRITREVYDLQKREGDQLHIKMRPPGEADEEDRVPPT